MKVASLRGSGLASNNIFDSNSAANRDDCFAPYVLLRSQMLEAGISLNTVDINTSNRIDIELHQDVKDITEAPLNYLLMFETVFVMPSNGVEKNREKYRRIFTWRDDLVDGDRFIKINFPNPLIIPKIDGWGERDRFCCLIAGNRTLAVRDGTVLYPERVKAIRWFEQHAPQDFDLYGVDWDMPVMPHGLRGKLLRRVWRVLKKVINLRPFPSYRRRLGHKREVLLHTRFAICYENVRDLPGYITEKIFDCFFSGCVPVYWGASNITDHIPSECFIDRRQFADTEAVYRYLKTITEEEFRGYQRRIAAFLASDAARPFGSEAFAETIVSAIVEDLGR
jgi:hypothetical protein